MATVNLGSIKFNWQGAYAGGTAYAVDDVVSYNGSSYVCTAASTGNLPTDTNFWDQMSSAGTNGTDGTDVGTVLTTQGDILYRDGSGLQRLGAGTSGQALVTGGSGANPSWSSVGGTNTPLVIAYLGSSQAISANTTTTVQFDSVLVDTDNAFNTSTYTFQPSTAGYYYINFQTGGNAYTGQMNNHLRDNSGNEYYLTDESTHDSYVESGEHTMYFNGTTDSIFCRVWRNQSGRTLSSSSSTKRNTILTIFKLIQ
jgi:hypothetical protein